MTDGILLLNVYIPSLSGEQRKSVLMKCAMFHQRYILLVQKKYTVHVVPNDQVDTHFRATAKLIQPMTLIAIVNRSTTKHPHVGIARDLRKQPYMSCHQIRNDRCRSIVKLSGIPYRLFLILLTHTSMFHQKKSFSRQRHIHSLRQSFGLQSTRR